jgi:YD repeat-containing protein
MSDLETALRTQLHDRLDDLSPSTLTAQLALRSGQRARRRRTAVLADSRRSSHDSIVAASALPSRAVAYAEQFRRGDFATIRGDMTAPTRAALTEATLQAAWNQIVAAYGHPTGLGDPTVTPEGGTTVLVPLRFARGAVDMRVTYDAQGRVIGVTLLNAGLTGLPSDAAAFETQAREIVAELDGRRFSEVYARFDQAMAKALPIETLRQAWQDVAITKHGGFVAAGGATARQISHTTVVDVFCTMHRGELKVRVSFDASRRIVGLYLLEP